MILVRYKAITKVRIVPHQPGFVKQNAPPKHPNLQKPSLIMRATEGEVLTPFLTLKMSQKAGKGSHKMGLPRVGCNGIPL